MTLFKLTEEKLKKPKWIMKALSLIESFLKISKITHQAETKTSQHLFKWIWILTKVMKLVKDLTTKAINCLAQLILTYKMSFMVKSTNKNKVLTQSIWQEEYSRMNILMMKLTIKMEVRE